VLYRPKVRRKFPHLTDERAEEFLRGIEALGSVREFVPRLFEYSRDPDDEPYINLAIAESARYLVSRDKDLLDLMNDELFRQAYPSLSLLNPVAFLQEIALERKREQKLEQAPERDLGQDVSH